VFFFKFFKNLHFFLWIVLIPLFVLLIVSQADYFGNDLSSRKSRKLRLFIFLTFIHAVFLALSLKSASLVSTHFTIFLSYLLCLLYFLTRFNRYSPLLLWFVLGIVVLQPLEVYHYFSNNAMRVSLTPYQYERFPKDFLYTRGQNRGVLEQVTYETEFPRLKDAFGNILPRQSKIYLSTGRYNDFFERLEPAIFAEYVRYKFILYDRVEKIDVRNIDVALFEKAFKARENRAFVPMNYDGPLGPPDPNSVGALDTRITEGSPLLQVIDFNPNRLKIQTQFASKKFLVYNDAYDPRWRVFLNGSPVQWERANFAFKGLWVTPGKQVIEFSYGSFGVFFVRYINLVFSYIIFFWMIGGALKSWFYRDQTLSS